MDALTFAQTVLWPVYFTPTGLGLGPDTTDTTSNTGGGTGIVDKILGWLNTGSEIYQNTKNNSGNTNLPTTTTPLPATTTGMSTTTKIAIGAGVVVLVGGIIYLATKKKKK